MPLPQHALDYFTIRENRLTPTEAAKIVDRSVKTLAYWRTKSLGPPFTKIRGHIYYDRPLLEEWLKVGTEVFGPNWS